MPESPCSQNSGLSGMAARLGAFSFWEVYRLKNPSKSRSTALVMLLSATLVVVATSAQAPQGTSTPAAAPPPLTPRTYPAPVNLKVLPKNLTGQQVHNIMEQWNGELGVRCGACHAEDPGFAATDGPARPALAEDSKALKEIARLMYTMTEEINTNYIVRVAGSSKPVTCGTCHRGDIGPEPFTILPVGGPPNAQVPSSTEGRPLPQ